MTNTALLLALTQAPQNGGGGGLGGLLMPIIMIVALIAVFFFTTRSQRKQEKETANMRNNLQVGDEITTIGGICGKIIAVKDETESVIIETGSDRARIRVKRWAIGSVETIHDEDE